MSILSDRTDKARFAEDTFLFLFSVALVAVATIVLFSIASISQLDDSKATLRGSSPIDDNNLLEDKVIGTVVSYPDSNGSPVRLRQNTPARVTQTTRRPQHQFSNPLGCRARKSLRNRL